MTEIATTKCPHCFGEIDPKATVCRHCGRAIKTASQTYKSGTQLIAFGLLIAIMGIFVSELAVVLGLAIMGIGAYMRISA